jgi:alkane 1-monooxygenase
LPLALLLASVPAAALLGGWALLLPPAMAWWAVGAADALFGRDTANADPDLPEAALRRHRALTLAWPPVQLILIFGTLAWVTAGAGPAHLSAAEQLALFFGVGVFTGTIGITYAHEMMHQRPRVERALADLLLASVLYGHFRSEHLLVHHRHVATPRDTVTARYGESFYRFFRRVLAGSLRSALKAEAARLRAAGRSPWHRRNPFWRYTALQAGFLAAALALGGAWGLALFAVQAATAIWVLELTNYVEHYGLTRRHLGGGRYEPAGPHHSWNSDHAASNRLLINLQRHSDHHVKPARRFPLLQTYAREEAPQLPLGYPLIAGAAMVPPLWRRIMHPRLKAWRRRHYPDIADWSGQGGGEAPGTS